MLSEKIENINALLDKLMLKQEQLKTENEDLQSKLKATKEKIKEQESQLKESTEKLKVVSLAKSMDSDNDSSDKKELKLKINEMLREIDKCIAVLNT